MIIFIIVLYLYILWIILCLFESMFIGWVDIYCLKCVCWLICILFFFVMLFMILILWGIELWGLLVVGLFLFVLFGVGLFAGWLLLSNVIVFLILFV